MYIVIQNSQSNVSECHWCFLYTVTFLIFRVSEKYKSYLGKKPGHVSFVFQERRNLECNLATIPSQTIMNMYDNVNSEIIAYFY